MWDFFYSVSLYFGVAALFGGGCLLFGIAWQYFSGQWSDSNDRRFSLIVATFMSSFLFSLLGAVYICGFETEVTIGRMFGIYTAAAAVFAFELLLMSLYLFLKKRRAVRSSRSAIELFI